MMAAETKTTCPYCGVGCGVIASVADDGGVSVRGDPDHPANFGRLCSKGSALAETIDLDGRLLFPEIRPSPLPSPRKERGEGYSGVTTHISSLAPGSKEVAATFRPPSPRVRGEGKGEGQVSWDEALDLVARKFSETIAEHGPDSVAFYVSGQLLTEDYYVANKLMKGFIGSANIDTNSRLCMASSVAGHRRAFGSDTVPGVYEDLEEADLIILTGSNLAWCHPVLYQRIASAKEKRPAMKIVVIDPRRTMTCDIADMHLAVRPDGDVALFNGLLAHLAKSPALDDDFIREHTNGFAEALAAARTSEADIISLTGLSQGDIEAFYRVFEGTQRVVTCYSQGVNQSSSGTDKVNAIINCHLATGRIGRPGMGPFSLTGQPNAMGGREVGGLANMLAAHMEIENPTHRERVQRFWNAPVIAAKPGLKAVDMFKAVADGRIKALWIMGTNPVVSMPDADSVADAIRNCPFVVVSDIMRETDTTQYAHVLLPAAGWGEKDGTVTNSERRISRQRQFLAHPGEARADWRIICDVARRMGFGAAFAFENPAEIFAEHAALSAFENGGDRDFDIGGYAGISPTDYDVLKPFQWPAPSFPLAGKVPAERADGGGDDCALSFTTPTRPLARTPSPQGGGKASAIRFFANGNFYHPDRKARFIAVESMATERVNLAYPSVLNTGRIRDQWHTMTRTGKSARLSSHLAEPFAEINPDDAAALGIADATLVQITSPHGKVLVRALITSRQPRGSVFVPIHWTDQYASNGRVDALVPPVTDPVSGQPALKNVAVSVEPYKAEYYGFAVSANRPLPQHAEYFALAKVEHGFRMECAFAAKPANWEAWCRETWQLPDTLSALAYFDRESGNSRIAFFDGERLVLAFYAARGPVAVSRTWAVSQLGIVHAQPRSRIAIMAGRPGADQPDIGAIVCSCFSVGVNQIVAVIDGGCGSVEEVGVRLKAGTNCGSCRAEIRAVLDARQKPAAQAAE
ncbi:assimilatory nitrate reductase (NADH) alpha subunit apoprotein [Phyllobacterium leguminum]|uniref:Assimilatory nitrate reductase (NADH) alpha subunit apoprotein n=1 Tax=Phyllobacterium leguminum TaxID=314237 RepID=A0A318SZ92_9HYPH|nr:nitrate reductase [Phyllobacterium leguminum]PYE86714.1 assimilatory nitrate reductase (NADH) alpha subunit apoprotein [Phyllobacterium leguminum]